MIGYDCRRDYEFDKALEDLWRQADVDILPGMRERSDLDPDERDGEKDAGGHGAGVGAALAGRGYLREERREHCVREENRGCLGR